MTETFDIAGYCRISVDEELDRDNVSIENQKAIIRDFVNRRFPGSSLTFYEDRDRSGYTFEQREGYQAMRKGLIRHQYDILVVKDFSRFSRRNSRGLVELEDLRDAGVRIISVGDNIDFPNDDDWLKIQFQFLINEMPVTDTSKKVKNVIRRRQADGKWLCAAPYGYIINKQKEFEIVPTEAEIVRQIFDLYNNQGWGYKKIANYLTEQGIPTPRMSEQMRKEAAGEPTTRKTKAAWAIVTVQGILDNDFYIGTFRQAKYTRAKINGKDVKRDEEEHIVIENHHQPIIDYRTFATTRALREKRSTANYRGVKKYDNVYSGFLFCGDCGSPMFSMSSKQLDPAYTCGTYHRRGRKGCTSHHTRVDFLDSILKMYIQKVKQGSANMIDALEASIRDEKAKINEGEKTQDMLRRQIDAAKNQLKVLTRQKIAELMRKPEQEEMINETYDALEAECYGKIRGLESQLDLMADHRNNVIRMNRIAKTALDIFDDILNKPKLKKQDIEFIVERIDVYDDHIDIQLKSDIDALLHVSATQAIEQAAGDESSLVRQVRNHKKDERLINSVRCGDPLEIYTDKDGEVILKKYSPIGEISNFAKDYTESLFRSLGHIACITDKDMIVSASGVSRKELWEKPISRDLEQAIQSRQVVTANRGNGTRLVPVTSEEDAQAYTAQVICPIIADGESIGAVVLLSREPAARMGDTELKVAETTASIVGRQMEQ